MTKKGYVKLRFLKDFVRKDFTIEKGRVIEVKKKGHKPLVNDGIAEYVVKPKNKTSMESTTEENKKRDDSLDKIMDETGADRETAWKLLKSREEEKMVKKGSIYSKERRGIARKNPYEIIDAQELKDAKWKIEQEKKVNKELPISIDKISAKKHDTDKQSRTWVEDTKEALKEEKARQNSKLSVHKITGKDKHQLLMDYAVWDEQFNAHGELKSRKLNLTNLAELIFKELKLYFLTTKDNEEIFCFNGGYYESRGEQLIRYFVEEFLGKDTKKQYKTEVVSYILDKNYQDREIFTPPLRLINLKNGVYDIKTRKMLPHSPDHYFINEIPVNYNPKAKCPKILKFLNSVMKEEDIPTLQETSGYCLYRSYFIQKAVILVGGGANGKGTFFNILRTLLGTKNISGVELAQLDQNNFAVADLYGKLANVCGDLPKTKLHRTGKFKKATGGDILRGEKKGKDPFYFINYAKMLFAANQLPETADDTEAFFRRWIILIFPYKFVDENEAHLIDNETIFRKDPNIIDGLITTEELEGFLLWILEGLHKVLKNDAISYSKTTEEIQDYYERLSNPVAAFVKDEIEVNAHCYIVKDALYEAYKDYSQRNKLDILPKQTFTKKLQQQPIQLEDYRPGKRGERRERCWKGIRYTVDETINNYVGEYTPPAPDETQTSLEEEEKTPTPKVSKEEFREMEWDQRLQWIEKFFDNQTTRPGYADSDDYRDFVYSLGISDAAGFLDLLDQRRFTCSYDGEMVWILGDYKGLDDLIKELEKMEAADGFWDDGKKDDSEGVHRPQRMRLIMNIIKDNPDPDGHGTLVPAIIKEAKKEGINEKETRNILDELKRHGLVYTPMRGRIELTSTSEVKSKPKEPVKKEIIMSKSRPSPSISATSVSKHTDKHLFTKEEEVDIKQIIKDNPNDNFPLLTSKYGEGRIIKATEAGILTETFLGRKLEFNENNENPKNNEKTTKTTKSGENSENPKNDGKTTKSGGGET